MGDFLPWIREKSLNLLACSSCPLVPAFPERLLHHAAATTALSFSGVHFQPGAQAGAAAHSGLGHCFLPASHQQHCHQTSLTKRNHIPAHCTVLRDRHQGKPKTQLKDENPQVMECFFHSSFHRAAEEGFASWFIQKSSPHCQNCRLGPN